MLRATGHARMVTGNICLTLLGPAPGKIALVKWPGSLHEAFLLKRSQAAWQNGRLPCAHGPSRAASSMLCERSERADNKLDKMEE